MRNEPKPLDQKSAMRAYTLRAKLAEHEGDPSRPVGMNYVRRDGQTGTVTGEVRYFSGRDGMDTMSVTVRDTEKGDRTINLCRVIKAWPIA